MSGKRDYLKFLPIILTLPLLILLIGCYSSAAANEVLSVYAAAGSKPAIDDICREFEKQHKIEINVTYGCGGEVLSQIELTRIGDIYIAPEQQFMESAVQKELIDPATLKSIAYMIPVIAVRKGNPKHISGLEDLARPGIRIAVTRPEATLLGKYAPEIFEKADLTAEIEKNIVTHALRPDSLLTILDLDQVDAGIIWHFYQTEVPEQVEIIWLKPEQLTGIGEIQAATTTFYKSKMLTRQFIDFLTSPGSKIIFEKHGYIVDIEEVCKYWHQQE